MDKQDKTTKHSDLQLVKHDISANAPEAPELDHSATAPEVGVFNQISMPCVGSYCSDYNRGRSWNLDEKFGHSIGNTIEVGSPLCL